jgi:hypothetical protein
LRRRWIREGRRKRGRAAELRSSSRPGASILRLGLPGEAWVEEERGEELWEAGEGLL